MDKKITLEEIRKAQYDILVEITGKNLSSETVQSLEKTSQHLRNLERLLVSTFEKKLIVALKNESMALNALTEEMNRTSEQLSELTVTLRKIVKITGQIIDILELVK
ncbi:MAG: hypothetical protein M0R39_01540 [Prolixibacteraceae bacterium]|nr:hypothetical protein [Prolixibacteraceae bacterium]